MAETHLEANDCDSPLQVEVRSLFAANGRLAGKIPGFVPRTGQQEMAVAVAAAIESRSILLAEAGTGTGKTFAYLAPALHSGVRTLISTGTRNLQDQLFHRDLPRLRSALGVPIQSALLKGRSNYVCWFHLERNLSEGRFLDRDVPAMLRAIRRFAATSPSGDRSSCAEVPENGLAWAYATSTRDNCLGSNCPYYADCFVFRARREAAEAELIVVNHHLFFSDQQLKEEGVAGLLPQCDLVVFDEAHQLPELLPHYYSDAVSSWEALRLAQDARRELLITARDFPDGQVAVDAFEKATRDARLTLPLDLPLRSALAASAQHGALLAAVDRWVAATQKLADALAAVAERDELLHQLAERAKRFTETLTSWRRAAEAGDSANEVVWFETSDERLTLYRTPLTAADALRALIASTPAAWVFTSATLTVAGAFDAFLREVGLAPNKEKPLVCQRWASPFDYREQALLLVPEEMPEPSDARHRSAVAQVARRLATAAAGRTMVLATSLAAMRAIAQELAEQGGCDGHPFVVLTQGDAPKEALLEQFAATPRAILVASHSFWEGVDIVGEALSVVVIDRLPFAPPDEPVLAARLDRVKRQGGDPFLTVQLPRAAMLLQQGAGRLIRSEEDRGVLCICDVRLATRGYGRLLWSSLPPFRRTRSVAVAESFLHSLFLRYPNPLTAS